MEPTNNEGSSSEAAGIRNMRQHMHPQSAHTEHGLYFDSTAVHGHTLSGLSEGAKSGPQSHPMGKSCDTRSPPPNSATTSDSISTPNSNSPSTGGLSSSVDGAIKHPNTGHGYTGQDLSSESQNHLQQVGHTNQGVENWTASAPQGMMPQGYPASHTNVGPNDVEQNLAQSAGGPYNPAAYPSAIKLLVSNNVAGSIIGRAGQTISELQSQSSARIKLSQTGDFYPGTQDRVCLVQGQLEDVKLAVRLLLERLHMLQEQQHSQHLAWQPKPNEPPPSGFDFVVRLLVPSSSCGMIIGKSGSNIKHMEESSGVSSVRLSAKESSDPSSPSAAIVSGTSERVVTLTGPSLENCLACLCIVLDGMMAHHEICRYSNMTTSYSRVVIHGGFESVPPPGTVLPAGRQMLVVPQGGAPEPPMWETGGPYNQFPGAKRSSSSPNLAGQMPWDQRGQPPPYMTGEASASPIPITHHPRDPIQQYVPSFTEGPQQSFPHEMPVMMQSPARGPPMSTNAPPLYLLPNPPPSTNEMDHASAPNSVSAPDLLALRLQDSLQINATQASGSVDYTHFAPQLPQATPPGFTAQVLVPDTLIGSILGRGGRTLNELQMHSNSRIRISQRGEYVPGTRNRIVTIRGPTAQSVSLAQYLMSQRMVLPPTATYSPQAPFHPPPVQAQQQPMQHRQVPLHSAHQSQSAHGYDFPHSYYHGAPSDSAFQPPDVHGQHPLSAPSISRSSSNKEHPHT